MFEKLKQSGHLAEKDIEGKMVSFRVDIWEAAVDVSVTLTPSTPSTTMKRKSAYSSWI